jgi:prepilin-type N-terminal cleavage/methylation domain-containing protein
MRRGFTLPEMLIVILIVGIMSGLVLAGLSGAVQLAREQRTRAIIGKLDLLIGERWDGYSTRAVPMRIPAGTVPVVAARARLYALRELQRMEMPDHVTDLIDGPVILSTQPSAWKGYRRRAQRESIAKFGAGADWTTTWTAQHQGSECLYLILSQMHDGDKQALDYFSQDEIGDVDDDGMKEILDGWGQPIEFLRWPAGFTTANGAIGPMDADFASHPDPFDPLKCDPRWLDATATIKPYMLTPLLLSAGRDKAYDISILSGFKYSTTNPANDPYYGLNSTTQVMNGTPRDNDGDGLVSSDNITNLAPETP